MNADNFNLELHFTNAHRRNANASVPLREARCRQAALKDLLLPIGETELIVGAGREVALGFRETSGYYCDEQRLTAALKQRAPGRQKRQLRKMLEYWRDKTTRAKFQASFTEREKAAAETFAAKAIRPGAPGSVANYDKFFRLGVDGYRRRIKEKMADWRNDSGRKDLGKALLIACDMFASVSEYYAREAARLARRHPERKRRGELEEIAKVCQKLSAGPPETFQEALQAVWFLAVIADLDNWGRIDQHLFPFFRQDLQRGILTLDKARALLESLWIKCSRKLNKLGNTNACVLGGERPDGRDAANELTYLCLEVTEKLRLPKPDIVLRCHRHSPEPLLSRAVTMLAKGGTFPILHNSAAAIRCFTRRGVPIEEARNYVACDCGEISIPGKSYVGPDATVFFPSILVLTLHDGRWPTTGKRVGLKTGAVATFKTFQDLVEAFKKQAAYFIRLTAEMVDRTDAIRAESAAYLFRTLLIDDCLEKGLTLFQGGAHYNSISLEFHGLTNVADSLAAVKSLVYEDQAMSLPELVRILDADWKDNEPLRLRLKNKAPKFGNDEDFVDAIAREITEYCVRECKKHKATVRGGDVVAENIGGDVHISIGTRLGATPEGRKAGAATANAIAPMAGADKNGPTACIRSVTKIDHSLFEGGLAFNIKFSPRLLRGGQEQRKFIAFLRTYFGLGGMQMTVNAVGKEELLKAQKNPQECGNLMVRIGGYSARFVDLSPVFQEEIINRTEN